MRPFSRFAAWLLCLLPLVPAHAADPLHWPATWKTGDHWTYQTESLNREREDGKWQVTRATDLTDLRVVEADRNGAALSWTTRDSRIEAIEGDRKQVDAIAPLLDQFDGYTVVFELDGDGRYRRIRNIDDTVAKVRKIMLPLTGVDFDKLDDTLDPDLSPQDRDAAKAQLREKVDAMMAKFFSQDTVEAMTNGGMKTLTAFADARMQPGKRQRDSRPIDSPLHGRPLPARREYVVTPDPQDPALMRVEWTHALDTSGDPAALWHLVAELTTAGQAPDERPSGRPADLELREEGVMRFRRDTGVVETVEVTQTSRYGEQHRKIRRDRMRLQGSRHVWPRDDAPTP